MMILGNHDLRQTYLRDHLSDFQKNPYVSTNVLQQGEPFAQQYKYMTTKNGLRVLMFGFTVQVDADMLGNKFVVPYAEVVESEWFHDVI